MGYRDRVVLQEASPFSKAEYATEGPTTTKIPAVESAINRLASLVNSLEAKLGSLRSALTPVLSNTPQPPLCQAKEDGRRSDVPLASEITDLGNKVECFLDELDDINTRIEV